MRLFQGGIIATKTLGEKEIVVKKMILAAMALLLVAFMLGCSSCVDGASAHANIIVGKNANSDYSPTADAAQEMNGCKSNDDCDDGVDCTADTCNHCTGVCKNTPLDARCKGDACEVGHCVAQEGCVFAQIEEGGACNDGNPCTVQDKCDADGECQGEVAKIGDKEFCTECEHNSDCEAYIDCADGHLWAIEHIAVCKDNHTCATRVVSENSSNSNEAIAWKIACGSRLNNPKL